MRRLALIVLAGLAAAPALPTAARAQWVFVARRVLGRVEQMTQAPDPATSQAGYDVATVILDANPRKVFAAVIAGLGRHPEVRITSQDAARRRVDFASGDRSASISVFALSDDVAQLMVASASHPGEPSATARVLEGVMNVCRAMKKTCTVGGAPG